MAWYNASWTYRVQVTIQSSQVDSDLTDFPVYVDLSDLPAGFFTNVDSAGDDIRVTRSDGTTECAFEVVSISTGSSTGELHFKANFISSTSDTSFYIYYGNAAATAYGVADTYGRNAVWSDYDFVGHGNDLTDATGNGSISRYGGTATENATGKLSGGAFLNNSQNEGHKISGLSPTTTANSAGTIQCWFYVSSDPYTTAFGDWNQLILGWNGTGGERIDLRRSDSAANQHKIFSSVNGGSNLSDMANGQDTSISTWYMVHCVQSDFTNNPLITYVDGVEKGKLTSALSLVNDVGATGTIGIRPDDIYGMIGSFDEVRFRVIELSPDWISAEYTNQNTPNTFYTVGSQESGPTGWLPSVIIL